MELPKPVGRIVERHVPVVRKEGSPWEHYEKMHDLRLGLDYRAITVAEDATANKLANVYLIRSFSHPDMKTTKLMLLRDIQHQNIVSAYYEIFWMENICYVIFEHMLCSLYEVRESKHPTEL